MAIRVACTLFLRGLKDTEFREGISETLALGYEANLKVSLRRAPPCAA
jgi:hypothetical protein